MKVAVIGDIHVSTDYFISQLQQLPWLEEVEFLGFDWYPDTMQEFQKVSSLIEKNGPENVSIPEGLIDSIGEVDAIFTHFCPINKSLIEQAKKLKLIGTCRGGIEHISPLAQVRNIPLINVIRNAEPVADFTLGLILAETRNISRGNYEVKSQRWTKKFPNSDHIDIIRNLKVGIVGFGSIGQLIAKKLLALDVSVGIYDPFYSKDELLTLNNQVIPQSFDELLQQSDVVSIHIRMEPDQAPLFDETSFNKMKSNSVLINTSRAYAVDQDALINALINGTIASAALDVFWEEPLPENHPLLEVENVTLTPHIAGDTALAIPHSPKLLVEKILEQKKSFSCFAF